MTQEASTAGEEEAEKMLKIGCVPRSGSSDSDNIILDTCIPVLAVVVVNVFSIFFQLTHNERAEHISIFRDCSTKNKRSI